MKIAVLIKQVPDTASKIVIKPDRSGIDETGIKFIVNPYDEYAIEEALRAKKAAREGETVVISMGPERCMEAIRTALAMGVDKAIHIDNEGKNYDGFATAQILAKVLRDRSFDLIFCGKQAIDGDQGQVTQAIGEFLDIPQVTTADQFEWGSDEYLSRGQAPELHPEKNNPISGPNGPSFSRGKKSARIIRKVSGGTKEVYETVLPVIVSWDKTDNNPRFASLPGIMKAKTKPVEKLKAGEFAPGAEAMVQLVCYELPPEKVAGRKVAGEPPQQAAELVKLLREEAKVI